MLIFVKIKLIKRLFRHRVFTDLLGGSSQFSLSWGDEPKPVQNSYKPAYKQ